MGSELWLLASEGVGSGMLGVWVLSCRFWVLSSALWVSSFGYWAWGIVAHTPHPHARTDMRACNRGFNMGSTFAMVMPAKQPVVTLARGLLIVCHLNVMSMEHVYRYDATTCFTSF
jgi:hypothetical protein